MEKKKEQKIILPDRSYKVNDLQNGKTFYYKTKIQDTETVRDAMCSLLKHEEINVRNNPIK